MPCDAAPSGTLPLPRLPRIGHRLTESSDTQLWADIYSIEVTSSECLAKVRTFLSCRSSMNVARSFQGNDARAFIDFLDQVSGESSTLTPTTQGVKRRFLYDRASMTNSASGVYCFCPRSAKPMRSYPPRTFFNRSSYALGGFSTMEGSRK